MYRRSRNAIVYCRSCKAKITKMDSTCPACGAATSPFIPLLMGVVLCTAVVLFLMLYRENVVSSSAGLQQTKQKQVMSETSDTMHTEVSD